MSGRHWAKFEDLREALRDAESGAADLAQVEGLTRLALDRVDNLYIPGRGFVDPKLLPATSGLFAFTRQEIHEFPQPTVSIVPAPVCREVARLHQAASKKVEQAHRERRAALEVEYACDNHLNLLVRANVRSAGGAASRPVLTYVANSTRPCRNHAFCVVHGMREALHRPAELAEWRASDSIRLEERFLCTTAALGRGREVCAKFSAVLERVNSRYLTMQKLLHRNFHAFSEGPPST